MAEKAKNNKEQYRQARDEFDSLKIEEKAIFLVESAFSMLAHGIEAIGNVFSEQINNIYQEEKKAEKKETKASPKRKTTTRKRTTATRSKKTPPKADQ